MTCKECKQPLVEINFNTKYYVYKCNNWRCPLYMDRQGIRKKGPEPKKYPRKKLQPGYNQWLYQKNINYHKLRSLHIPSKEAANVCGNYKRTRQILEKALV